MDKSIIINYKNIEYTIWFSNDLKLCCNKKIDGNFVMGLDNADKKIISGVFDSLCVSKLNSYFIRSGSVNGVSYNLFYDYNKSLYFTDSFDEGVNSFINLKYNNMPLVYNSNEKDNNSSSLDEIKRFSRQAFKGLVSFGVGLSIGLLPVRLVVKLYNYSDFCNKFSKYYVSKVPSDFGVSGELTFDELNVLNNIADINKFDNYNITDVVNNGIESSNITFDELIGALQNNSNVDDDFKEFFNKLDFAFEDNLKYIDSFVLDRIRTLKVEYVYDSSRGTYVNGEYYPVDNKIVYYNAKDFNEVDPNTALHELGHVFQSVSTNNLCFELSNEVWTRETLRIMVDRGLISSDLFDKDERGNIVYVDGYCRRLFLYYYLLELLPPESVKKFQWTPDDSIIVSSLADMNNEYEVNLAHEVLDLIAECKDDIYLENSDDRIAQIRDDLNYFYGKKYGIALQNDINLLASNDVGVLVTDSNLNKLLVQNSEISDSYNLDDVVYYGNVRSYFSDTYATELFCGVRDGDSDNRKFYSFFVDDELKYEFSEYGSSGLKKN